MLILATSHSYIRESGAIAQYQLWLQFFQNLCISRLRTSKAVRFINDDYRMCSPQRIEWTIETQHTKIVVITFQDLGIRQKRHIQQQHIDFVTLLA